MLDARLEYGFWIMSLWSGTGDGAALSALTRYIGLVCAVYRLLHTEICRQGRPKPWYSTGNDPAERWRDHRNDVYAGRVAVNYTYSKSSGSLHPDQGENPPKRQSTRSSSRCLLGGMHCYEHCGRPVFGLQKTPPFWSPCWPLLFRGSDQTLSTPYRRHAESDQGAGKLRSIALELLKQQLSRSRIVELSTRFAPSRYRENQRRILKALFLGQLSLFSERALSVLADISEIGLRAISKKEIGTAQQAIISISRVVSDYMLGRKGSVVRFPDHAAGLLVSRTNPDDFSAKSYELLLDQGRRAVQEDTEPAVVTAVEQLAGIAGLLSHAPARSREPSGLRLHSLLYFILRNW